ncbi:phosphoadenylyl-sulfate reductase [Metabacillus iocasae]|uniref:Adenosine 5'-phosphosulfate reductase n=1 Tax=Priestia iocasae TaxID=2291674 RepID=A0ABS2R1N1_9BACI|nr:phosphoadenylyl-sulfate reductase [Metabacillus iocasae]MBM7704659.1 phosphoadenosine phosphosulfate reductase [Metabacillus iocasae]
MSSLLTYKSWNDEIPSFSDSDESKGALPVLEWAYKHYGDSIVYASSFGIESIVLIDLIAKVKDDATLVFLDTDLHFKETYEVIEQIQNRFPNLNIRLEKPELTLKEQEEVHGSELWKTNPNLCCQIRKITPLKKALGDYEAWISGLRREQSSTRSHMNFLNKDDKFQKIKVCPIIHWTWKEIWRYVYKNNLPYNKLHDQGYPSIGCMPCTAPTHDLNDLRAGRWAGTKKVECGLHES